MNALVKVDFHGDTLFAQKQDDGSIIVAVKPIMDRLGLAWHGQFERLKRDELLASSIREIRIETPAGMRETTGLPLNLLPGFLFGISTGSIPDPEVKAAVLAYQRECHEVLYRHFFGAKADPAEDLDWEAIAAKIQLVREARLTAGRKAAQALWTMLGLPEGVEAQPAYQGGALQGIDFVRQWLEARTAEDRSSRVQASVLYRDFAQWLAGQGGAPSMTQTAFGRCMGELGHRKTTSSTVQYLGIRLKHISELMG